MIKEKLITMLGTVLALAVSVPLFLHWNPEFLFREENAPVTAADIRQNPTKDFAGAQAGDDIPRLSGAEDFSALLYGIDYATAEPTDIIATGVYSLKPWVNPYRTRQVNGRTVTGKRKPQIVTSPFVLEEDYNQYYLLKLPDGTFLLAQIPPDAFSAIRQGEHMTLPVGRKDGLTDTARNHLATICETYDVSMDGVFYAFSEEWYREHSFSLFLLRFSAAAVVFFVVAVGVILTGNRILKQ